MMKLRYKNRSSTVVTVAMSAEGAALLERTCGTLPDGTRVPLSIIATSIIADVIDDLRVQRGHPPVAWDGPDA